MVKRVIDEIKKVISSVEKDTESPYRQFYLGNDINVTRNVVAFVSLIMGIYTYSDFLVFNLTLTFFVLLGVRITLVFLGFITIRYISRLNDFRQYDVACFSWMTIISLVIIAINASRPENILPQIIILDIGVLISYLIIPTRFSFQAIPATIFSVGQLTLLITVFGAGILAEIDIIFFSVLFSNVIGAITSWQIHSYRWKNFQSHVKAKESEGKKPL